MIKPFCAMGIVAGLVLGTSLVASAQTQSSKTTNNRSQNASVANQARTPSKNAGTTGNQAHSDGGGDTRSWDWGNKGSSKGSQHSPNSTGNKPTNKTNGPGSLNSTGNRAMTKTESNARSGSGKAGHAANGICEQDCGKTGLGATAGRPNVRNTTGARQASTTKASTTKASTTKAQTAH